MKIKTPQIWVNGKRVKFIAQCSNCFVEAEKSKMKGWKLDDKQQFLCPVCQALEL